MPAPLLQALAAVGFLGGRSLIRGQQQRRQDRGARSALQEFVRREGDIGDDGYGPPVPFGDSNLNDNQVNAALAMAATDPQAAFDFAVAQTERNRLQQNFTDQQELAQAGLDQQRQNYELASERHDLALEQFNYQKQATADQLALATAALDNPDIAARQAALNNKSSYVIRDPENPEGFLEVPMAGTKEAGERLTNARAMVRANEVLNQMMVEIANFDPTSDPIDEAGARLQSLRGELLFAVKDVTQAGALDQGLIDTVNLLIPDATGIGTTMLSSPEASLARLGQTMQMFQGRQADAVRGLRGMQGVNPELLTRAQANAITGQALQNIVQRNAQEQQTVNRLVGEMQPSVQGAFFSPVQEANTRLSQARREGAPPERIEQLRQEAELIRRRAPLTAGPLAELLRGVTFGLLD